MFANSCGVNTPLGPISRYQHVAIECGVGQADTQVALVIWEEPPPAAHTVSEELEITESPTSRGAMNSHGDRFVNGLLNTPGDQSSRRERAFNVLWEPREQSHQLKNSYKKAGAFEMGFKGCVGVCQGDKVRGILTG